MDLTLPAGLRARPMTPDDTRAVTDLVAAVERAVDGVAEIDFDDIEVNFKRDGFDPDRDALVVLDGSTVVAWADFYRGRAEIDVHPEWTGRGIGAALLGWSERRAAELGSPVAKQTVTDANTAARALFERHGYAVSHTSWILRKDFTERPPAPVVPPGVTLRPYAESDAHAAYEIIEASFNEWPNREPSTFAQWVAYPVGHGSFAPELSAVAFDGDEMVGVALMLDYADSDEGWVEQLATKATHRNRGIARALLDTVFAAFYERGKFACGLSTDSRTGALSLYEHVGMHVRRSYTGWQKTLG